MAICILGAFLETKSLFSVWLMLGFGILGWVMHRFDYSRITFLIGFVVGPLFELVCVSRSSSHTAIHCGCCSTLPRYCCLCLPSS